MHGNVSAQFCLGLSEEILNCFQFKPLLISEVPQVHAVVLPQKQAVLSMDLPSSNPNSLLVQILQPVEALLDSLQKEVLLQLLSHYLDEPFFNALRTKQQLGYVVSLAKLVLRQTIAIRMMIQS